MSKKRVAVIFGGRSGEHEVSLNSAASVIGALDGDRYEVIPVAITREGKWLAGVEPARMLAGGDPAQLGRPVVLPADPTVGGLVSVDGGRVQVGDLTPVDVVIPVLHGTFGEDGTVQGLLELANIPYVGAGVMASAVGMDKIIMKTLFARHGLPQVNFRYCSRRDWERNRQAVLSEVEQLGYPLFVKPANLGSSVGISKARSREELVPAMDLAAGYDRKIIVEEFVPAREVEVSVLGNDDPMASLPGEIIPLNEFYDYEAKYVEGKSDLVIPARLPAETMLELQRLAIKVFKALDCAGMARVDFFLRKDNGAVLVNEINTIPGFTRTSMYPKLWEATGITYPELLDRLIELALERHREKNRSRTTFQPPVRALIEQVK
ncbi:D-alanine--D-alanine ligase [Desulfofundulus thermobenzoicus]|uniref:D-alanine--D-alanine ligase n=1 Tax=Desulfofundulus thermobenzoicus TaxID=29376 RepID=A0A6N7IVW0_9FIRM|nr:D-alanine--D-alanine ligase family protein [Desulfofundulus thermobenzoicus]MQL53679.1 D-alanine--D-alanine ligase [Desulfofundulus thermobenzoicus]